MILREGLVMPRPQPSKGYQVMPGTVMPVAEEFKDRGLHTTVLLSTPSGALMPLRAAWHGLHVIVLGRQCVESVVSYAVIYSGASWKQNGCHGLQHFSKVFDEICDDFCGGTVPAPD